MLFSESSSVAARERAGVAPFRGASSFHDRQAHAAASGRGNLAQARLPFY